MPVYPIDEEYPAIDVEPEKGFKCCAPLPHCATHPRRWQGPDLMKARLRQAGDILERRFFGETHAEKLHRIREQIIAASKRPPTPRIQRLSRHLDAIARPPDDNLQAFVDRLIQVARQRRLDDDESRGSHLSQLERSLKLTPNLTFGDYCALRKRFSDLAGGESYLRVRTMPTRGWVFAQHLVDGHTTRKFKLKRLRFDHIVLALYPDVTEAEFASKEIEYGQQLAALAVQTHLNMACEALDSQDLFGFGRAFLTEDKRVTGRISRTQFVRLCNPNEIVSADDAAAVFDRHSKLDDVRGDRFMDFEDFIGAVCEGAP